eukprot:CAMPEP_0202969340 /NCGR_PEP_ID=MMETSP1396-20130829/15029_1 /ASSEMBLY_ACC=CAM_ASM_000872 /TAXON_ID= /ORGANISM="Pseudokeronopsis sp., Strain Brazil" /LENGTH=123 /DNA_ID=CAMNT_0049696755 /DNA_START=870 /DNA_END=1241 /DNA_ORIENTATION=+
MKEGVLTYLAKALRDKEVQVKMEANAIIKHLINYVDNKVESFRPLITPLISALGDSNEELVCASLDTLAYLSQNPNLRDFIVEAGCVPIICSIIQQDLKEVPVAILKQTLALMVKLCPNVEAR